MIIPIQKVDRRIGLDSIRDSSFRKRVAVEVVFAIKVVYFGAIGINLSTIGIEQKSPSVVKGNGSRDSLGRYSSTADRD